MSLGTIFMTSPKILYHPSSHVEPTPSPTFCSDGPLGPYLSSTAPPCTPWILLNGSSSWIFRNSLDSRHFSLGCIKKCLWTCSSGPEATSGSFFSQSLTGSSDRPPSGAVLFRLLKGEVQQEIGFIQILFSRTWKMMNQLFRFIDNRETCKLIHVVSDTVRQKYGLKSGQTCISFAVELS